MKNFKFFHTDYYQIAMGFSYVVSKKNKEKSSFEGFVRNIKKEINPNQNFYIFSGENEIHKFMKDIKQELNDPEIVNVFIKLVEPKIKSKEKKKLIKTFIKNWKTIDKDFTYTVAKEGSVIKPLVPVFQFTGDKMIGQMIETFVTNIYNGKTALKTIEFLMTNDKDFRISNEDFEFIKGIVDNDEYAISKIKESLNKEAKNLRKSTDKVLLEASFRRSPSFEVSLIASEVAIKNGFEGTSNVAAGFLKNIDFNKINGTMAHAFVMSYDTEKEAFIDWDKIFPGTSFLIDTYDVVECAKLIREMIDKNEISIPESVRIDSDPLDFYIEKVSEILPEVKIFISGDMEIEKFEYFKEKNINFDKTMVGTKYVYNDEVISKLNSGFVYKIVEYEKNGKKIRPEKKANGKKNYTGLKYVKYNEVEDTIEIIIGSNKMGFENIEKARETSKIKVIEV